jgi:hypothetical protein
VGERASLRSLFAVSSHYKDILLLLNTRVNEECHAANGKQNTNFQLFLGTAKFCELRINTIFLLLMLIPK